MSHKSAVSMEKNIRKVYLLSFLSSFHFFSAVLIPFFTLWGKLSFTQILILQSIFQLTIVAMEVPTGVVADKLGRKFSIAIGFLLTTIGALVYASVPNFWVFVIAEVLFGVGVSFFSGATEAFVYDTLKQSGREKGSKRVFIRLEQFNLLGLATSAPIGSVIAHYLGLRAPMLLTSVPLFLGAIIALSMKEPEIHEKGRKPSYLEILKSSIDMFKKRRELRILSIDMVVVALLSYFYIWGYQAKLMQVAFPIALFGVVHATIVTSEAAILHFLEKLEKLVGGKKNYLFISAVIPGVCYLLIGASSSWIIVLPAMIAGMAFGLTRRTPMINYINKFVDSEARATTLSFINLSRSLMLAIINPVVGKAMDINLNLTFIGLGIILLAVAATSRIEEEMLLD